MKTGRAKEFATETPPKSIPNSSGGEHVSLVWESLLSLDHKVPVTSYLIFYLHTMEGWKIREIAELFQISPDQVRARSHRVKKKFGSIIETKERESGKTHPSRPYNETRVSGIDQSKTTGEPIRMNTLAPTGICFTASWRCRWDSSRRTP